MNKIINIAINAVPVLIMIGFISLIKSDYILMFLYILIIIISLFIKREKNDLFILAFGFIIMTIFEYIFISTGVEIFIRNSLMGVMPIWLPFLWAYGFVAIKRSVLILSQ